MSDLNVCLVCLCKDVKMYDNNEFKLKVYYEEDMDLEMIDGLPQNFCYLCAAMLYKYHKFKEKCHIGQQTLKELLACGPISSASISQVDRKSKHLQTPLGVITVSKRVKTYTFDIDTLENVLHSPKVEPTDDIQIDYSSDQIFEYTNICKMEIEAESSDVDEQQLNFDEQKVNVDKQKANADKVKVNVNEQIVNVDKKSENIDREKKNVAIENLNVEWHSDRTDLDESRHPNKTDKPNPGLQNVALHVQAGIIRDRKGRKGNEVKVVKKKVKNINKKLKKDNVIRAKRKSLVKKSDTAKDKPDKGKPQQLDPEYWLKISMTEQEAMDDFIARSREPRYKAAAYKCDQCYTAFSKEEILTRHTQLVHDESRGQYECHFCCRRFNKKGSLTKHKPVHYHKFKCLRCDLIFLLEGSALKHNDLHTGFIKKCEQCALEFRHLTTYYSHLRIYHRSEHVCTLCGASFVSQKGLQQHKNLKHINADVNPDETGENTYCEKCDIKFSTRQAFNEHFSHSTNHAEVVLPIEPTEQDEEDMPANDIPTNTSLKGSIITPDTQRNNKNRVTTTCFVCQKVFLSYYRYKKHHRAEHKDVPIPEIHTQMCDVCGITIKATTISVHMNTHTRKIIYPCPTCGMKFTLKSNMYRHMVTHTVREKSAPNHKCPLCDKRYTEKGSMTVHYRTVHLQQPHPRRNRKKIKEESKIDGE